MSLGLILIVALIGFGLFSRTAVKTVERSQRLVIERFGRFSRWGGPGRHMIVPFVETGRTIELDDFVRGWQGMTEREVEGRLLEKLYGGQ